MKPRIAIKNATEPPAEATVQTVIAQLETCLDHLDSSGEFDAALHLDYAVALLRAREQSVTGVQETPAALDQQVCGLASASMQPACNTAFPRNSSLSQSAK